ncbi:hypothetical protein GQ464_003255 [Rhodocaloribacter litoris]|uniref:hypothetical protein n=1 Tax=Rhodocaloribacter litoris TaxID=2558931 RepID=UPI0014217568|nr:hypothetical protein [Rhodocaloribacter litoris]QXD15981.1 hypothetical protein GQ464_003255 [Rhodocaloribacter litoris]GIV59702.1 MAG: hypothetical protein KatS3mg043_0791 [Rhodothermaceae bacterium]
MNRPPAPRIFRSTLHPGTAPATLVYGRALVRPLGACVLPVMVGALLAVLQEAPALAYLTRGFPAALAVAMLWTHFRLRALPAEVQVVPGAAAVRTVWACARNEPPAWFRILDLRLTPDALQVTLGYTPYTLPFDRWPEHDDLLAALQEARNG